MEGFKIDNSKIKILILSLFFISSLNLTMGKTCSNNLQCRDLERNIILDQNLCIGQAHTFENIYGTFFGNKTTGATIPYLMDKQYTEQIQTGYTLKYGCVNNQCQIVKREPITKKCTYGCLVTPTAYNGKNWHDFCICKPGYDPNSPIHCGPNGSRYAYYLHISWTCEKKNRIAGICGIGQRCVEKPTEVTCEDIPGPGPIKYPDGTSYAFVIPKKPSSQIYVAAIQNGKIIASKPISNLSAMEYINKYGAVHASQAAYFAQATGLTTTIANTQKTITPSNTSITTAYASYTPRTTSTYTYKPSWNNHTNTTLTNTHKPNYYSNYYTRTYSYTPKTSYTPYTYTRKTTRAYNPNYYTRKSYTPKTTYTYKPTNNYTRTYTYTPSYYSNTNTRTYSYTPRANYTSRTFTRNTYTPTTNYTRTYSYKPKTTYNTNTRTYSYKPRTSNTYTPRTRTTYTYKPNNTTTSTTYSRYYKRTYT